MDDDDLLSADDVGCLLSITRQAVDERRRAGALLAIRHGSGDWVYPTAQFHEKGTIPGCRSFWRGWRRPGPRSP